MLNICLSFFLVLLVSCQSTNSIDADVQGSTCAAADPKPGYYCDSSGSWQLLKDGNCTRDLDCPAPINTCSGNVCVKPAIPASRYWFATDPIRPGVTVNCGVSGCSNYDYIYNIMAKGYDSLDDWCMSQAQQSKISKVRDVADWTALIVAMPDSPTSLIPSFSGLNRIDLFTNTSQAGYIAPDGTGYTHNITDKHGTASDEFIVWSGMSGTYGQDYSSNYWRTDCGTIPYNWFKKINFDPATPAMGDLSTQYVNNSWSGTQTGSYPGSVAYFNSFTLSPLCVKNVSNTPVAFFGAGDSTANFKTKTVYDDYTGNGYCENEPQPNLPYYYPSCHTDFLFGPFYAGLYSVGPIGTRAAFKPNRQLSIDAAQSFGVVCLQRKAFDF